MFINYLLRNEIDNDQLTIIMILHFRIIIYNMIINVVFSYIALNVVF